MAVVRTQKMYILGKTYILKISCDNNGRFSAPLPDYIAASTNAKYALGATLDECRKVWIEQLEGYKDSKSSKSNVLIYNFEIDNDEWSGMRIGFSVSGYIETVLYHNGKKTYSYEKLTNAEIGLPDGLPESRDRYRNESRVENILPLNTQNVRFFVDFYNSFIRLQEMIERISTNPDRLLAAIKSRFALLAAPESA